MQMFNPNHHFNPPFKASADIRSENGSGVPLDALSPEGICPYLKPEYSSLTLEVYPEVSSTNTLLRERAAAGAPEGSVILASAQTAGRGRIGHRFYSPAGTGIYMSLLLRPTDRPAGQAERITTMAAAAACQAIEEVSGCTPGIKWVNDIFLDGRKIAGILTEGSLNSQTGCLDYAVLGIGINVYPPSEGFPQELRAIAGSIFSQQQKGGKNRLAAAFLNHFMDYYKMTDSDLYQEVYRSRSLALGRQIKVITPEGEKEALALDIDADCHLMVRYEDGSTASLTSGEISIRL